MECFKCLQENIIIIIEYIIIIENCTMHTFQVQKWVGVRVPLQDSSEERRAGRNYHLSLELKICD